VVDRPLPIALDGLAAREASWGMYGHQPI
jgi:hypothetical protein